jgi:Zn-dependent protease
MAQPTEGSIRLFRAAGIDVYLHWSWLIVAAIEIQYRATYYTSMVWNILEYVALFGIVLVHEFGHALACRSVGGVAQVIVLWPLGGVAYVSPPPRPGAVLWSIAAGPLVNVVLVPVTFGLALAAAAAGWDAAVPGLATFLHNVALINLVLLVFNLLPVYPLDGGQIVQALLWFVIGRVRSLMVVSVLGLVVSLAVVAAVLLLGGFSGGNVWLAVIAAYAAFRSFVGFQQARQLSRLLAGPRHKDAACPSCGAAPLQGEYWACGSCGRHFDLFSHRGTCPQCGARFQEARCADCYRTGRLDAWLSHRKAP